MAWSKMHLSSSPWIAQYSITFHTVVQLQESRGFRRKIKRLEEINKKLSLELEHERGKLTGLGQSNAALREHNRILEAALAKREADLVQLNLQVRMALTTVCPKACFILWFF